MKQDSYKFSEAQEEWIQLPVDDVGYFSAADLMKKSDAELQALSQEFEKVRYDKNGYRNYNNLWRHWSGVDEVTSKIILDFGCGVGIESLQFAKNRNSVILVDINRESIELARRVLEIRGYGNNIIESTLATNEYPFFRLKNDQKIDIFYSNGVLHHTPKFREILERVRESLSPNGEVRLMLYSDIGWKTHVSEDLPGIDEDVRNSPHFEKFVKTFDAVGKYADWYNLEKLQLKIGDLYKIKDFSHITSDSRFLFVILEAR